MNLFYKIHLQAFNVISIVLYHSVPMFGRFPRIGLFNFGNKSKAGGLMSGLWRVGSTCHPYISKISDTAPEAWGRTLMYDRWSLSEIWLQSDSSSISRLRFAEQVPRSLPIRTQRSLLKSGSRLSLNQNYCIILLAVLSLCAELLNWATYYFPVWMRTLLTVSHCHSITYEG